MYKRAGSIFLSILLAVGFALSVTTKQAHAYIDIGSAAFMIQIAVASLFGALFSLKIFWGRIIDRISRLLATVKGTKRTTE